MYAFVCFLWSRLALTTSSPLLQDERVFTLTFNTNDAEVNDDSIQVRQCPSPRLSIG